MADRFNITYRNGSYRVSLSNYEGGEVVDAASFDAIESTVDLLERNARIQAKLLADTGRQRDALADMLKEARLQIEYMQSKFDQTGTGNAVLARINATLSDVSRSVTTERSDG